MASTTPLTSILNLVTGAGTAIDLAKAKSSVTAIASVTGTVTSGMVEIQGSHNGTVWVTLDSLALLTGRNQYTLVRGAFRYFRGVVVSDLKGGGSVTVTFMEGDPDLL